MLLVEQYTSIWYERVAKGIAVLRGGVRAIWLATRAPVNRSGLPPRTPGVVIHDILDAVSSAWYFFRCYRAGQLCCAQNGSRGGDATTCVCRQAWCNHGCHLHGVHHGYRLGCRLFDGISKASSSSDVKLQAGHKVHPVLQEVSHALPRQGVLADEPAAKCICSFATFAMMSTSPIRKAEQLTRVAAVSVYVASNCISEGFLHKVVVVSSEAWNPRVGGTAAVLAIRRRTVDLSSCRL